MRSPHHYKKFAFGRWRLPLWSLWAVMAAWSGPSQGSDLWQREHLTGQWGGLRDRWEAAGIDLDLIYTGEVLRNTKGGIDQGSEYLDNIDLTLALDAEKLWGMQGGTLYLYIISNNGGAPGDHVGAAQGVTNIEAPSTTKLYEAWYEQGFGDEGQMSLLFGLYDLNAEFDLMPSSRLFINPSHGIGPEFSQSGINGPSIFPTTSLGLRFRSSIASHGYLLAAIWDGVPGDPGNHHGTHIKLGNGDGTLMAIEAGVNVASAIEEDGRPDGKVGLGFWRYSAEFDDLTETDVHGNPVRRSNNQGLYLLSEYALTREAEDPMQGLSIFARAGIANDDINPASRYMSLGLIYTGPFEGRDGDRIGLAAGTLFNGDKYVALTGADEKEMAIELTYSAIIAPWLAVQPGLQYNILKPPADPEMHNSLLVGMRFEIAF